MKTYLVSGLMTVRFHTRVRAENEAAARSAANSRQVIMSASDGYSEQAWVIVSNDAEGRPRGIQVDIEEEASE